MAQENTIYRGRGVKITDGSADVDFDLLQGRYVLIVTATWGGGSLALKALASNGSTYVTVDDIAGAAASLTADGSFTVDLPAGSYRIDITTATAVYATLAPAGSRRG